MLNRNTVRAWIEPSDWTEAGRIIGKLLVDTGGIEPGYIEKMIEAIERLGPYIVIVPGVAIFHSRADEDVHNICLALVTVKDGVSFNAGEKDPVKLIFAFAAIDKKAHLVMLREIMAILKKPLLMKSLIEASTEDEILNIIHANFA